jgi:hypothetical protein
MWFGIIFVGPLLRVLIGREPGINDLVFYTTSGFSLFYGLLLGLLAVAAYQNLEQVRQNVFGEASSLASLYRDASLYPEPVGSEFRDLPRVYTLYVIYKDWSARRKGRIYNGGTNRLMMIEYTILAFFLGIVIFLIIAMDRPMRGEVSVPPAAYQLVYDVLMQWDDAS